MALKRTLIVVSLVAPLLFLGVLRLYPDLDIPIHEPLFHFYIVTFFTFAAAAVSFFIAYTVQEEGDTRYQLLPTAFAAMGGIFIIHGILTPEAIFFTSNPGVRWAGWLTLFVGGWVFVAATFNPNPRQIRSINLILFFLIISFLFIVIFAPHWLSYLDENVAPFHRWIAFGTTIFAWVFASLRLTRRWYKTGEWLEGVMALIAAWQIFGAISLHLFTLWHLSWWLYHIELLMGVLLASWVLVRRYERLRQFQLTRYFALTSLIAIAATALLASHFFARFVERELVQSLREQAQQSGLNVAMAVYEDLPEPVTPGTLNAAATGFPSLDQILWQQLSGLSVEYVNVYDQNGFALLNDPYSNNHTTTAETDMVMEALEGTPQVELVPELSGDDLPDEYAAAPGPRLRTYAPIKADGSSETIGVLLLQQPVPELNQTVTRARLQGLLIGGSAMGLLFLALLGIVRWADLLITTRTNELAQANTNLRAAEAARDELTHMIVHDLRTPLTTVIMGLDWLQRMGDEPQREENRQRFLSNARTSAERLVRMINDLLDVNRLEAGRLHPYYAATDITQLLKERAAAYTPLAESDEKQITVQPAPHLPLVPVDAPLLERVLDNLIGNALKYTNGGGQITLTARRQGGQVIVSVADNGEGIPLAYQPHIFDKFVQVVNDDGQPIRKGTGLGLTFCRLVVEAHQGRIWVESQPEQGSTFYFTLPIQP